MKTVGACGKLYFNETGRMLSARNEGLSSWSWARKDFSLSENSPQGKLFLFAYEYPGNEHPLIVRVNGRRYKVNPYPEMQGLFSWKEVVLRKGSLRRGTNEIVFSTHSRSFSSWTLAIENGKSAGTSYKSIDRGASWQSDRLGLDSCLQGEYLVRLWIRRKRMPPRPRFRFIHEDPAHPRLKELRGALGLEKLLNRCPTDLEKQLALRAWVSAQWRHRDSAEGGVYTPWDAFTILDWTRQHRGYGGKPPVAMCVHFSVLYAQACLAYGFTPKLVVLGQTEPAALDGHFVAEVWNDDLGKWLLMDSDLDVHFEHNDLPLNALEVHRLWEQGNASKIQIKTGKTFPQKPPALKRFLKHHLLNGGYQHWGMIPRNDFFSHPECFPVEHGVHLYHQTHFVWWACSKTPRLEYHPHYSNHVRDFYFDGSKTA